MTHIKAALLISIGVLLFAMETTAQSSERIYPDMTEIAGELKNVDDEPIEGARVSLHPEPCTEEPTTRQIITTTNAKGQFYAQMQFQKIPCLFISWDDLNFLFHEDIQSSNKVMTSQTIDDLGNRKSLKVSLLWKHSGGGENTISSKADGKISGRVYSVSASAEGETHFEPIAGAIVSTNAESAKSVTGTNGRFEINNLPRIQSLTVKLKSAPDNIDDKFEISLREDGHKDLGNLYYFILPEKN